MNSSTNFDLDLDFDDDAEGEESILKKLISNSHVILSFLFGLGGLLFLLLFLDSHYKTLGFKTEEYVSKFGTYPPQ